MNPEQQRIAIAKACGWKFQINTLPNYLHDLNAMHEAEEKLDCNQWEVWHRIVGEWPTELARLTASQRAEAFLRTIGKWKEDKL